MVLRGTTLLEHGTAWVVRRRGEWLGIPTVHRPNGALGWIRDTGAWPLKTTRLLVRVDLSQRRMRVTSGGWLLMTAPVAVGSRGSPSPTALTSVSARIPVTPGTGLSRGSYGPMIVSLRLWQPASSPGTPNGGVMAFHGGGGSVGAANSGGCFRMRNNDVLRLARFVRAGTPVIIDR